MKRKVLLSLGAVGTALTLIPLFAAFEAHVVNVTARIEDALEVPLEIRGIDFGTVFPQEKIDKTFDIHLSRSFVEEDRVDDVEYVIRQKPKCQRTDEAATTLPMFGRVTENEAGDFVCEDEANYEMMPLLCPYLSKHEITRDGEGENDSAGINAFHGLPGSWTPATTLATQVRGKLQKLVQDLSDTWNIDLRVPCFKGSCAQDWPDFVRKESASTTIDVRAYELDPALESELFGCDLWVEVTHISLPPTTGTITINKTVLVEPGAITEADFSFTVGGLPATEGVPVVLPPGTYSVVEVAIDDAVGNPYTASFSGDCTGDDTDGTDGTASSSAIVLAAGASLSCNITNDFGGAL
jgi:hypothetical protein